MNPNLQKLQPYPFQKLAELRNGITPPEHLSAISLSIGEPKHPTPHFISEAIISHMHSLASYPLTKGSEGLRSAIAQWLTQRFSLPQGSITAADHVLPVSGTREALFSFAQAIVDSSKQALVLSPNPFYQIYEGAALLAGATPYFLPTTKETNFKPDFSAVPDEIWQKCQLIYICTPGNPTGAVLSIAELQNLILLADQHDFIIASDECYSEIYFSDNAPAGLLQAAAAMGRTNYERCIVFHSLSKRSNAPGMRSGFVAGDATIIAPYLTYRTYHGATLSPPMQAASMLAWEDNKHVAENRALYQQKFYAVLDILKPVLEVSLPDASFYLWPKTPDGISDIQFTLDLYQQQNVAVLPGQFLSREVAGVNPGKNYVRMALVAPLEECCEAAQRIRTLVESY